jgi:hypothetical protein
MQNDGAPIGVVTGFKLEKRDAATGEVIEIIEEDANGKRTTWKKEQNDGPSK